MTSPLTSFDLAQASGILLIDHVNFAVPYGAEGNRIAKLFYLEGLGCSTHPFGTRPWQLHANFGLSQFHIPHGFPNDFADPNAYCAGSFEAPHVLDGHVVLWASDLPSIEARLASVSEQLQATKFRVQRVAETAEQGPCLRVTCPFGNLLYIKQAPQEVAERLSKRGAQPGGRSLGVAMGEVRIKCRPGSSARIGNFYREVFKASVQVLDTSCRVYTDCEQCLVFEEDPNAEAPDAYKTKQATRGYHVSMYVKNWEAVEKKATELGLVYHNPRFVGLDKTLQGVQFRLLNITDLETGELLLMLEQEVGSVQHRNCPLGKASSA